MPLLLKIYSQYLTASFLKPYKPKTRSPQACSPCRGKADFLEARCEAIDPESKKTLG